MKSIAGNTYQTTVLGLQAPWERQDAADLVLSKQTVPISQSWAGSPVTQQPTAFAKLSLAQMRPLSQPTVTMIRIHTVLNGEDP